MGGIFVGGIFVGGIFLEPKKRRPTEMTLQGTRKRLAGEMTHQTTRSHSFQYSEELLLERTDIQQP